MDAVQRIAQVKRPGPEWVLRSGSEAALPFPTECLPKETTADFPAWPLLFLHLPTDRRACQSYPQRLVALALAVVLGSLTRPQAFIHFAHQVGRGYVPKGAILHDAVENLFVSFHAIYKQTFEHPLKDVFEIIKRINLRCRSESLVFNCRFGHLIKE